VMEVSSGPMRASPLKTRIKEVMEVSSGPMRASPLKRKTRTLQRRSMIPVIASMTKPSTCMQAPDGFPIGNLISKENSNVSKMSTLFESQSETLNPVVRTVKNASASSISTRRSSRLNK